MATLLGICMSQSASWSNYPKFDDLWLVVAVAENHQLKVAYLANIC